MPDFGLDGDIILLWEQIILTVMMYIDTIFSKQTDFTG
jgi:hypothetical protein